MNVEHEIALLKAGLINAESWATKHALIACASCLALGLIVGAVFL